MPRSFRNRLDSLVRKKFGSLDDRDREIMELCFSFGCMAGKRSVLKWLGLPANKVYYAWVHEQKAKLKEEVT